MISLILGVRGYAKYITCKLMSEYCLAKNYSLSICITEPLLIAVHINEFFRGSSFLGDNCGIHMTLAKRGPLGKKNII